jgi:hypothetical protein
MKLAIFATIGAAFRFCWYHRGQFYSLALPAIVVLSILSTLASSTFLAGTNSTFFFDFFGLQVQSNGKPFGHYSDSPWTVVIELGIFVLMVVVFPLYSVAWHRLFLLPQEDLTILDCYRWQSRHWSFLWANIKIFLFIIPMGLLGFLITAASLIFAPIVGIVIVLFVVMCYARFSMWLPAAALDTKLELADVLEMTKGHGWQLAAILIITGLATGLMDGIATGLIAGASGSISVVGNLTQSLLTNLALFSIMYAGMAVGITALSMAYAKLTELNP